MNSKEILIATKILRSGGVVAHACEGVWGLACDPFSRDAAGRVLRIKQRNPDKGLIVIGSKFDDFNAEISALDSNRRSEVEASWPGPETWVAPTNRFPDWITGGRTTIAFRVPGSLQARQLCRAFGGVLVSTSANQSGSPPAMTENEVARLLGKLIDYILPGHIGKKRRPSRIRNAITGEVLR